MLDKLCLLRYICDSWFYCKGRADVSGPYCLKNMLLCLMDIIFLDVLGKETNDGAKQRSLLQA